MKRLAQLTLLLAVALGAAAQPLERPRVAVVLSGGGAKGVAHIGALRVIEEAGLPIDMVCGTSMGSLIGALYCVGYSTAYLDSLVRSQDWTTLLSDRTDPAYLTLHQREEQNTYALIRGLSSDRPQRGGLIRGRNLDRLFRRLCAGYLDSISFDSLPIPFACVATDLVTNTEVDFRSGYLVRAMRASMAIPGVFTPVRMGDSVLVDGGLRNNYPADLARRMGADIIIGVTVQGPPLEAGDIGDAATVMMQIIDINCKHKYDDNVRMSDLVMRVDVSGYSAASFFPAAIDTLILRGEREARRHWEGLLALRRQVGPDSVVRCHEARPPSALPDTTRPSRSITRVPIVSLGFRFDTEEMGALQVGGKMPLRAGLPMELGGTLRLGKRLMARAEYSLHTHLTALNPTVAYTFRNNDLDLYTRGVRSHNVRYYQHTADLTPLDLHFHRFDLRAGARWDFFNFYGQLLSSDGNHPLLEDSHHLAAYLTADLNSEDLWYFPTRGTRFHASLAHRLAVGQQVGDLAVHWRFNASPFSRLTLQPMLYARLLSSADAPWPFRNALGGEWFGHVVEQQLPFAGLGHMEYVESHVAAAQVQVQYRVYDRHYLLLRAAVATSGDHLPALLQAPFLYGAQLGYSIDTFFGPIDLRVGYTNRTRSPWLFLSLGHTF